MPHKTLQKYSDIVVANADHIVLQLSLKLQNEQQFVKRQSFGGTKGSGFFYLYRNDIHPGKVFECVMQEDGQSISSLYLDNRVFGSVGELIRAREELVDALGRKVGLSPTSIGIEDSERGLTLAPAELSTGQLIDLLADRMGDSIVVTNNHAVLSD